MDRADPGRNTLERASRRNIVEVVLAFLVLGAFLWLGRGAFPGANLVFAAVLLTILVYSHRQAHESLRDIGFRSDTFGATLRLLLPAALIAVALIVTAALVLGEIRMPSLSSGAQRTAQFLVLGIAQQYVLVGFFFRRLERVAGASLAPVLTALVFALLHLPNVFLMAVTFVGGVVACLVYRRSPNVWANGLAHGLLAALLYFALPRSITGGLRVGIEYVALLAN